MGQPHVYDSGRLSVVCKLHFLHHFARKLSGSSGRFPARDSCESSTWGDCVADGCLLCCDKSGDKYLHAVRTACGFEHCDCELIVAAETLLADGIPGLRSG